jgi:hypothetical protein
MFSGIVGSESLNNPRILNSIKNKKVVVEFFPNSTISSYWHTYFYSIEDESISHFAIEISNTIKDGCYAIFWNNNIVKVIFKGKIFNIQKSDFLTSKDYQELVIFAEKNGVQKEYLDFQKEFEKYQKEISQ